MPDQANRAEQYMSRSTLTVAPHDNIREALQIMLENRISTLPVVDRRNRCVGILSFSDLIEWTRDLDVSVHELEEMDPLTWGSYLQRIGESAADRQVHEMMTETAVCVTPEDPLPSVASRMLRERIHHLPVVDSANRVLGIISTTDIVRAYVDGMRCS